MSNAVYHRSYQKNEPITVRITPASIETTGFPGFDRSITTEAVARFIFGQEYTETEAMILQIIKLQYRGFNLYHEIGKNGTILLICAYYD